MTVYRIGYIAGYRDFTSRPITADTDNPDDILDILTAKHASPAEARRVTENGDTDTGLLEFLARAYREHAACAFLHDGKHWKAYPSPELCDNMLELGESAGLDDADAIAEHFDVVLEVIAYNGGKAEFDTILNLRAATGIQPITDADGDTINEYDLMEYLARRHDDLSGLCRRIIDDPASVQGERATLMADIIRFYQHFAYDEGMSAGAEYKYDNPYIIDD